MGVRKKLTIRIERHQAEIGLPPSRDFFNYYFLSQFFPDPKNAPQETLNSRCAPCVFTVKTAAARHFHCVFAYENGGAKAGEKCDTVVLFWR